jgi:two-component system NtrC family sensor kinase
MKPDPPVFNSSPLRIVMSYAWYGALWIIFSDLLVLQLVPTHFLATASIAKGWIFIAFTSLLLYHLIGRQLAKMAQLTAASRENEERLRTLEDNLPDCYVYQHLHEEGGTPRFTHLSAGVEKLHGVRRQDVLRDARMLFGQIDPEQLPLLFEAEAISLQTMSDFMMEVRLCRADGEWRWLQMRARPRRREGGQVLLDGVATDITARRKMEESLEEQKKFTEILIENSAVATFVLNAQHQVVLWNKACEELTGFPAGAMIGTDHHWQAFYDHERPCLADIILDTDHGRLPSLYVAHAKSALVPDGLHAEGWYKNLGGRDRYIQVEAAPVCGSDGTLLAAIETLQDKTVQKRTDEALLESTERMTVILDGINALIYVADLKTYELLFINKYGREIWGEITGKICWQTLQEGQSGPCAFCNNERLLTTEGVATGVFTSEIHNTITDKWYDCRDQAIRWSDGRMVRLEIATDITDRKKAETELRLQSAALHAAANAIVITDKNGTIEWVNPAFTALSGYSAEEAIGTNPREVLKSGMHSQAFFKELWDTLLAGKVWRGEITNRHKDGTLYPEGQTITPVKDASGEITHFIAIKRDLTEQHKLEAQLHHAQKMESIGTLAGGIAHDFNNILTTIIGYGTFALLKMTPDDPNRRHIQHMLEASDRAAHLTKDLLLFSRKQVFNKKPVELNLVVAKVEKFLKRVIGEDIEFKTMPLQSPLPVLADDYQLEQVLMNLATNARDAMPQGGTLTVTTEQVVLNEKFVAIHNFGTPGPYALINVTDTGYGMNETTRLRIFEPFFTTKEVGKGTGLGLAVAYGIIKQHDGYINVYSEPGTGTTFRIYLPLITAKAKETRRIQPEEASVGGTEMILLAEDDEYVRAMTRSVLTDFGYTIIEAVNGADAVNKFTAHNESIDLLLLDLIMPKMNGKEALDEIRKIRPGIKAIFSSGYAPETIRQKAALADGVHLIAKPASPTELLRKVRQVLDEDKVAPSL